MPPNTSLELPLKYNVLIVDDEPALLAFLREALAETYNVDTSGTGHEAIQRIDNKEYDILIIDLKLPDMSGIDILKHAKEKDDLAEALIITGYASLDTAARAINLGASSYLMKPLELENLVEHVDRSAANRAFHLKSRMLMRHADDLAPDAKGHLRDLTTLYQFSRRLLLSMEVPEIIEIILSDANKRTGAVCCAVTIDFMDFAEIYVMPHHGKVSKEAVRLLLLENWEQSFGGISKAKFQDNAISLQVFEGYDGEQHPMDKVAPVGIPMTVRGKSIGSLAIFYGKGFNITREDNQFLYVYSTLIASIIEHAYADMYAQLLAKTDSLTGIANFRLFHEMLTREIARSDRKRTTFCLILLDIDDFKKVNDTYGHPIGNAVLKDLTTRLSAMIRTGDLLARYGGEEFAIILPDTSISGATVLCERVRKGVESHPYTHGDQTV
ncbi:MAG: diguanylate cyclase, partial [Chitinivibrionales bacterium]|nr:diguanylate cyclase [Chitinivibrionales bacterium]